MNETQTPPPGPQSPQGPPTSSQGHPGSPAASAGVNREHLRDYEGLRRSRTDRKIAGVAGGLGRHLNIDPTVLRVLFVVAVFFGGAGLLLYAVAWLIVPEEGSDDAVVRSSPSTRSALLIVAAVIAGLVLLGNAWGGNDVFWWPLALVAIVVALVLTNRDRPKDGGQPATPPPPPPAPEATDSSGATTAGTAGSFTVPTADVPPAPPGYPPAGYAAPAYPPAPPPPPKKRGPLLFGITLALLAIALGLLGSVDAAGVAVADAAYPALALTVIGGMLVLGSVFGRPGGLVLLGLVAAGALAVTSAAGPYDYDTRQVDVAPSTAAEVASSYSVFAGEIGLDLSRVLDPENLDGRTVRVTAEAGELVVLVPDGVDVRVDARIDVGGDIWVDGTTDSGRDPRVVTVIDGGEDVPTLDLDLDLTVGSIRVLNPVEDAA